MKFIITLAFLFCASEALPGPDLCQELAIGNERDYADWEAVNLCYECKKHKIRLSGSSEGCVSATDDTGGISETGSFEIELGEERRVFGVAIRGTDDISPPMITKLIIYFKVSGSFYPINDEDGNPEVFTWNSGITSSKEIEFPIPVKTSIIQFQPMSSDGPVCMQVDVYGCEEDETGDDAKTLDPREDWMGDMLSQLFRQFCPNILEDCEEVKCTYYKKNFLGCDICECDQSQHDENYEGDMRMTPQTWKVYKTALGVQLRERGASKGLATWHNLKSGKYYNIPYQIRSDLNQHPSAVSAIGEAINELEQKTCIRLIKGNGREMIRFIRAGGCWSYVGKRSGGRVNEISIGGGCERAGTVVHEILHSLGFWHEQSRPDRDQHVIIKYENIIQKYVNQFQKRQTSQVDSLGSPYDTTSVMHYGGRAFSVNGKPTIIDKKTGKELVAQRRGLSTEDVNQLNKMYECTQSPGPGPKPVVTPPPTPTCQDKSPSCPRFKKYCGYSVIKKYCVKTCGIC